MKRQPGRESMNAERQEEIGELMSHIMDDVQEVRNLVKTASDVRQRVLMTLDKLRGQFPDHEALVRHARALATWAEREIDDVVFCMPAEIPQIYQQVALNPGSAVKMTKAQLRKQLRDESEEIMRDQVDDAVIDLDKANVTIPNEN